MCNYRSVIFFPELHLEIKVQKLLHNQQDILQLLRGIAAKSIDREVLDIKDLVPDKLTGFDELDTLCIKLDSDRVFRENMVIKIHWNFFSI